MHVELLLATAAALVGLYAVCFHAWVFALHRRALDHAWVALTAAGACVVSAGTALAYDATSTREAMLAQQIQALGSPAVTLGALLFPIERFGFHVPRLQRAALGYTAALFLLLLVAPELLMERDHPFEPSAGSLRIQPFELTALGAVSLGAMLFFFTAPLVLSARACRLNLPGGRPLLACFTAWTLAGLFDVAAGIGLTRMPTLMPNGGYIAASLALSAILLRDLARVMSEAERRGGELQGQIRARADALRAIDLRLARGEQLAAIGTLAAGVAHEINNPLAYVSANLNQLRALVEDEHDPDEVQEILGECREGLARVGSIANDLLRMGRHGESEHEACDLGEIVRALLPLVLREAGSEIEVVTDIQSPLPLSGHARLLRQAALNLALNAVHALREVRSPRLAISAFSECGHAVLCVRDNGRGVAPELRAQIFEAALTTKPEGSGSGLGLALTRLVVARHGGAIEIESDGRGTAVTIRLPLRSGAA